MKGILKTSNYSFSKASCWSLILLLFHLLLFGSINYVNGQQSNPFELVPRLEVQALNDSSEIANRNPFDITSPPANQDVFSPTPFVIETQPETVDEDRKFRRFLFPVFFIDLIVFTLLIFLFQSYFSRIFAAFRSDNLMSQLYRERETGLRLPIVLLYFLFFLNLGIYFFLFTKYFEVNFQFNNLLTLTLFVGAIMVIYLGKHIFLRIASTIFPVEKQIKFYSFNVSIFNIITGFALIPINLFIGFGPEALNGFFFILGGLIIIGIFIFRSLRNLANANRLLTVYPFHFLLYICTTEFVPLVIIYKLIRDQTFN